MKEKSTSRVLVLQCKNTLTYERHFYKIAGFTKEKHPNMKYISANETKHA